VKGKNLFDRVTLTSIGVLACFAVCFMFLGCSEEGDGPTSPTSSLPELTTDDVMDVTDTTAQCGGTVVSMGGSAVTDRGVCWSTSSPPTISDDVISIGAGVGSFSDTLSGLTVETRYYVRAYAKNSNGTNYGETKSFITIRSDTMTDIDGNIYRIIKIGDKWWMAENLRVTQYRNSGGDEGDTLKYLPTKADWKRRELREKGAYCYYNNDKNSVDVYGLLYNWYAVWNTLGLAPEGWHIPSDKEWKELEMWLGMNRTEADDWGWRGTNEGGKLKSSGVIYWKNPNIGGTNQSSFFALPAGYRESDGTYEGIGEAAIFWTNTDMNISKAWYRYLKYDDRSIMRNCCSSAFGYSIRCVKDAD
jgi:uncharacterized protein (TIGR02145 family)